MHKFTNFQSRQALSFSEWWFCSDLEAVTYSRLVSLKKFHLRVISLDLIFDWTPKTELKPNSNITHESPEHPPDPRFVRVFHSFIIQKLIQSHFPWALGGKQRGTVAMLQLGCRGNLGVIDAPAFRCRLGNALVFILPPFYGTSNTSSGHVKHARPFSNSTSV